MKPAKTTPLAKYNRQGSRTRPGAYTRQAIRWKFFLIDVDALASLIICMHTKIMANTAQPAQYNSSIVCRQNNNIIVTHIWIF